MRLPLSWLREYVEIAIPVEEVASLLVRLGHEVEAIEYPRAALAQVRVGQILRMEAHPNADRLRLLQVDIGEGEPLSIVCGASNMRKGDKIPLATMGARLPNGMRIKKSKVRGEFSFGMCCSAAELGLAEDADGLMILPADAPLGMAMGEYLELEEAIFELSITPNRGDCMSVLGLARDLAAVLDLPLRQADVRPLPARRREEVSIQCDAEADCPLYLARAIYGIRSGPSPDWLRRRLLDAGMRPVHGVVDVLNYIMLDIGQPMHAFDAQAICGAIRIRSARSGESFEGLDGSHLRTQDGDLLIADDEQILALAGILGSQGSAVHEQTTDIVLESAFFLPARISLTRRVHGLVSEASTRFERGVDPRQVAVAMERASRMIVELFGGEAGVVCARGSLDMAPRSLRVSRQRMARRLGIPIERDADAVLARMGFALREEGDSLHVDVPSWRHDVTLAEDMSEEYARIVGYDRLPARMPRIDMRCASRPRDELATAIAHGCVQVINYAFISLEEQRMFVAEDGADLCLRNPISETMRVMRRSLWPGLLSVARHNMSRQQKGLRLVEQGRIYWRDTQGNVRERNTLAWLLCGQLWEDEWFAVARDADFFDLKGLVEAWLRQTRGVEARISPPREELAGLQPGQVAEVHVARACVGRLGRLDVRLAARYKIDAPVWLAEIDLDALPDPRRMRFAALPEHPAVERDLVFVLPSTVSAAELLDTVRQSAPESLVDVRLFDVYRGEQLAEGQISMGVRLHIQDARRTLRQEECDALVESAVRAVEKRLAGRLR